MGQSNSTVTLRAAAAASRGVRMTINSSGLAAVAGNTDKGIGVLDRDVSAEATDSACIRLWGAGSHEIQVTGVPATAGDVVYAAALGRVAATGTITVGRIAESMSTNATLVEVFQFA